MIAKLSKSALLALTALSFSTAVAQQGRPLAPMGVRNASAAPAAVTPQTTPELLYVPLPVCRAFYTASSSGNINASATRDFYIAGSGSQFGSQGGPTAGCGVPANATAAAISFTAFNTTGDGGLVAYAQGASQPTVGRVLSYLGGHAATGLAIVPLANNQITLKALSSTTQAAGDVTGYYIPQIYAQISGDGTIQSGTSRIVSVSHAGTGFYYITIDRPARQCAPSATTYNIYRYSSVGLSSADTPNVLSVYVWYMNGSTPTPVDYPFFFVATC